MPPFAAWFLTRDNCGLLNAKVLAHQDALVGADPVGLNRQGFYFYLLTGILGSIVSGTVGATGCG
jgi:hypothetical protein